MLHSLYHSWDYQEDASKCRIQIGSAVLKIYERKQILFFLLLEMFDYLERNFLQYL